MTSNKRYTKDALEFFNVITGHSIADEYENLITAPIYMRNKIISLIEDEINNSIAGHDAKIYIKINSLQDKYVINKLYEASNVGVIIFLIQLGNNAVRTDIVASETKLRNATNILITDQKLDKFNYINY